MQISALLEQLHFLVAQSKAPLESGVGPLAGKRLIVKDLLDVAGEPTSAGCDMPIRSDPAETAPAVRSLLDAGARYIGKAHMVQLAFGGWGTNQCVGAPRNPWDEKDFRVAGGSSSGSAVALAAGFADIALGSDTGGSIRIPASLCGIVGLKPSQGKVDMTGVVPLAPSLDAIGPMACTVADIALCYAALAACSPVTGPAQATGLRFRVLHASDLIADPDVLAAYKEAVSRIRRAGADIQPLKMVIAPNEYVAPTARIMGYEAWSLHKDTILARRETADPGVLRRFETAATVSEREYRAALAQRAADKEQFARWFEGADFLITPATPRTAPKIDDVDEGNFALAHYTRMGNYLDLCGIALPCGYDRDGLPIGLQLLGRAGDEDRLIAAAWLVEHILALPPRTPPLHQSHCRD